jgi:hypothetical protein
MLRTNPIGHTKPKASLILVLVFMLPFFLVGAGYKVPRVVERVFAGNIQNLMSRIIGLNHKPEFKVTTITLHFN